MTGLVMVVPTRSRPGSVSRLITAWVETGAFGDGARMVLVVDRDDPCWEAYHTAVLTAGLPQDLVTVVTMPQWMPMVHKLNRVAVEVAQTNPPFAVGFAGDDHVPRTRGWVAECVAALVDCGSGIVYGADGYQDANLPTWWVMTSDIVRALGRMVPAPVEHLYCDNAIKDLGGVADCLLYLPDVLVEHLNPYAGGKAEMDAQYKRVNSRAQFTRDGRAYKHWVRTALYDQAALVRALAAEALRRALRGE